MAGNNERYHPCQAVSSRSNGPISALTGLPTDTLPPPPYSATALPVKRDQDRRVSIASLPLHLLHHILSLTLDPRATPSRYDADDEEEKIRRIWAMLRGLRGVDRRFYLGKISTHVHRSCISYDR